MNLGELLKIVLKKGDFLFLCCAAACVVWVHLSALHNKWNTSVKTLIIHIIKYIVADCRTTVRFQSCTLLLLFCNLRDFLCLPEKEHLIIAAYLFHSGSQVLDKELPQVVQGLQLLGLEWKKEESIKTRKTLDWDDWNRLNEPVLYQLRSKKLTQSETT